MYSVSEKFKGDIRSLLGDVFTNEDFEKGLVAFENIINIESEESNFDIEYGKYLNETDLIGSSWNVYTGCRIEGLLRKIEEIKGEDTDGIMLQGFYTRLGFYTWLDEPDIISARTKDAVNSGGGSFHLAEADAKEYEECSHYIGAYIKTYQLRNKTKAHDNPEDDNLVKRLDNVKSLFIVYWDQCISNYELIYNAYVSELVEHKINYISFAKEKLEELKGFFDDFLQLNWKGDENDIFEYDYSKSVKFIGEAGMGKTTQMKRMYFQMLSDVANGNKKIIPAWVELKEVTEDSCSMQSILGMGLCEYGHYYDLMIEKNAVALFLDGYNEILDDNVRRIVANEVDTLHKKHPEILIVLTDRSKKSNPTILMKNSVSYTFNGLSKEEIEKYALLKSTKEKQNEIVAYLKKTSWIYSTNMIPEKMNNLIDLLSDGIEPDNEDEFYDNYLEYILDREIDEKKETRIEDLKFCLGELTQVMNDARDEKTRNEIVKLWQPLTNNDLHMAQDLFDLAIRLPILKPGIGNNTYMFVHPQYFVKCEEGF